MVIKKGNHRKKGAAPGKTKKTTIVSKKEVSLHNLELPTNSGIQILAIAIQVEIYTVE